MTISQPRALTAQSAPPDSAAINRRHHRQVDNQTVENRSRHGVRDVAVNPDTTTSRAFLRTLWDFFTRCRPRPKRGAALSVSPRPASRALSLEYLEKACKDRFDGLHGWYFGKDLKDASKDMLALWDSYSKEHQSRRDEMLQDPQFREMHKNASLETKFVHAEIETHHLMQSKGKYPKNLMAWMEPLVERLAERLRDRFGVTVEKREARWTAKDREILMMATGCVSKMKAALPKKLRSLISPEFVQTFCDNFHEGYIPLRQGISERRCAPLLKTLFMFDMALGTAQQYLFGPTNEASTPHGEKKATDWAGKMYKAGCKYLGAAWDVQEAYERIFSGSGKGRKWTDAEKSVLRGAIKENSCEWISVNEMQVARWENRAAFPAGITEDQKEKFNAIYDEIHRESRAKLLLQHQEDHPDSDAPSRFHWADTWAHKLIEATNAPELPEEYRAWAKTVSDTAAATLAARLFISSTPDLSLHL